MKARRGLAPGIALVLLATGAPGAEETKLPPEIYVEVGEEHTMATLPPAGAHRVYVVDPVFPHLTAAKTWIVEGDTRRVVGMLNAGYVPNFQPSPDHQRYYLAETFFSRGTRGERTDVVTIFDARTLEPTGEIPLPGGRFLVVTKKHNAGVTPDGRYLLSFDMAPTTKVTVVDLEARKALADVETPGCALVFPSAPRRFSMLCANGSLLTVRFEPDGEAESVRGAPFFDARSDPVFEHPAYSRPRARAWFVSYAGRVYAVDLSQAEPRVEEPWWLASPAEREAGWRPGGWQLAAVHAGHGRLYVLMHQGAPWTHKQPGSEVWAFDVSKRTRVARWALHEPSLSIAVSQDPKPQLYALSEAPSLQVYALDTQALLGTVEKLGDSPLVLHVVGE